MQSQVRKFLNQLVDFALPPQCALCSAPVISNQTLCASCWSSLTFISAPYCEKLGIPFAQPIADGALSAMAMQHDFHFDKARAAVRYDETARQLVSRLKYKDRPELASLMAKWMTQQVADITDSNTIIVPIPLHLRRLISRRYNQSSLLAMHLAKELKAGFEPKLLRRTRHTKQQVGLTRRQREKNVRGAFEVHPKHAHFLQGAHILLVDDVFTTGSTLNSASKTLLKAGANSVNVATFAIVDDPK